MDAERSPLPDAYTRASNPERFRVLHAAAREIIDDLAARYAVERRDYTMADADGQYPEAPATRLIPADRRAGPLTVVFTSYPGLDMTIGRWRRLALPPCGCDACDEQPDDLIEELREEIGALVTGRFEEHLTRWLRPGVSWQSSPDGGSRAGWTALTRREARRMAPAGRTRWAPWPPRPG